MFGIISLYRYKCLNLCLRQRFGLENNMNKSVKHKSEERPLYAGHTSYFYLKIIPLDIAKWFCVLLFVAALGLFAASILGELGDIMTYASAGAAGLFLVLALVFQLIRARCLSSIQYDVEIFGDKKSSKEIRDHADHSRLKFIYFRMFNMSIIFI